MLEIKNLQVAYEENTIIKDLSLTLPKGEITTIIGPNGCGKSTLLKALARLLPITAGNISFEGQQVSGFSRKFLSQKICLLSQHQETPSDWTVEQLVYYGRVPHKKWYEGKSARDAEIMEWALEKTGLLNLRTQEVASLSGGQRQRAFIAQALARQPEVLLLDEPTTYLDIAFQLEVMELVREINEELGITVIMVLHDLNQATRYSRRLVVMNRGEVVAYGEPEQVISHDLIRQVYGIHCEIETDACLGCSRIYPLAIAKPSKLQAM